MRAEGLQSLGAPAIAGLQGWYVRRQLENFRSGRRGADPQDTRGQQMRAMALTLESDAAVADVVAYLETLPPASPTPSLDGDVVRGRELYATCTSCHGDVGQGSDGLQAPALRYSNDWYLLRQLENFHAGRRGAADGDAQGAQMRAMSSLLADDRSRLDVVAYVAMLATKVSAAHVAPRAVTPPVFGLASTCPPSFELAADGRCEFRSLYGLYASAEGHGGLKAQLPAMRGRYTPGQIDLGRYLFFDRALSRDGDVSCADCHEPALGFSDGRPRSLGFDPAARDAAVRGRQELARGAPTLWNVGFLPRLFWDGRAESLGEQAAGPLFSPDEMANTPERLSATLSALPAYRELFAQAYARPASAPVSVAEVVTALAAFQSSLVSFNSRYDRYAWGDADALTSLELEGYNVFRGFVARCSQCHIPPLFTDGEVAVVGAPAVAGLPYDKGAGAKVDDPALVGGFRTPTLRNVARTAPYFNAGQFATLEDTVRFYNDARGHAVPPDVPQQVHWHIAMARPMLSANDVTALVAFLGSLTDESLLPRAPPVVPSGLPVAAHVEPVPSTASLIPSASATQESCRKCLP